MEKVCWNCGSYKAYYIKGYCCFIKEECGRCWEHSKVVDKHATCENWREKKYQRKIKTGAVIRGLDEALKNIDMIKQILTENEDD